MIRYFATTDDSPAGRLSLEYLKGVLLIDRVRVLTMSSGMHGPWERYSSLLMVSMTTSYVNVVCCDPSMWVRTHRIQAPLKAGGYETITARAELYTVGVRNVLIAGGAPDDAQQLTTASRYEAVIVSNLADQAAFHAADVPAAIILPTELEGLRVAIRP